MSLVVQLNQQNLLTKTDSNTPDKSKSYKDIVNSMVGMPLETMLDFTGSKTVKRTLDNGVEIAYKTVKVTTDEQGLAEIEVIGITQGFPTLLFSLDGEYSFDFSFASNDAYVDFLAPVRVLPHDDSLMTNFVNKWNSIYQQENAKEVIWNEFIYPEILEVFYFLYPIMDKYMPLDSLDRVESAVDQLILLISSDYREESTLAMPITRDLPSSSRQVLEMWAQQLVKKNYPPKPLTVPPS